jgi:ribose-phosphate pyrophosphokinase
VALRLISGSANRPLAEEAARSLNQPLIEVTIERFPDGELEVAIAESVRDDDVYLVQPTCAPVGDTLIELLLLADAARRAGAARVTAVIPYFGYARQDRRASGREPVSARLVADLIDAGGVHRVVAVDLHTAALEGFFAIPLEHLTAVPTLAEAARAGLAPHSVVVAPDLGAVKLAERYGSLLQLPAAFVHKTRLSGTEVRAGAVIGEVKGRAPVIVDDMISTGGTIAAATTALLAAGAVPDVTVVTTHALLVGPALQRLAALPLRRLIAADTVMPPTESGLPLEVTSVAPLLAEAVDHLHYGRSLRGLLLHQ